MKRKSKQQSSVIESLMDLYVDGIVEDPQYSSRQRLKIVIEGLQKILRESDSESREYAYVTGFIKALRIYPQLHEREKEIERTPSQKEEKKTKLVRNEEKSHGRELILIKDHEFTDHYVETLTISRLPQNGCYLKVKDIGKLTGSSTKTLYEKLARMDAKVRKVQGIGRSGYVSWYFVNSEVLGKLQSQRMAGKTSHNERNRAEGLDTKSNKENDDTTNPKEIFNELWENKNSKKKSAKKTVSGDLVPVEDIIQQTGDPKPTNIEVFRVCEALGISFYEESDALQREDARRVLQYLQEDRKGK